MPITIVRLARFPERHPAEEISFLKLCKFVITTCRWGSTMPALLLTAFPKVAAVGQQLGQTNLLQHVCSFHTFLGRNSHVGGANSCIAVPGEKRGRDPNLLTPLLGPLCWGCYAGAVTMRFLLCVGSLPRHITPAITIVMGFHQMGVKLYQE